MSLAASGASTLSYKDLREFIAEVDSLNALRRINGADPHFEIGGITEVAAGLPDCPALLFDDIKGHARGFRVFTNATTNVQRAALALGIDPSLKPLEALKAWMSKRQTLKPRAPVTVRDAAFFENAMREGEVDLEKFPAPYWHRGDGGPYIGSGSLVIMRDADNGWVNASIYRVQVHGRNKVTVQFDHQGRHGAIIAKKYWDQGKLCPIAVVNGEDPALNTISPAPSRRRRSRCVPARRPGCRCLHTQRSFWKASCCRQVRRRCQRDHSVNSPATTPRTSALVPS
jgi:UbiD family decarboxylase